MPPVMFEQIDAEIADDRGRKPAAAPAKPPNADELTDQIRRELAAIQARCSRLAAD
jgi:hypothetical protein